MIGGTVRPGQENNDGSGGNGKSLWTWIYRRLLSLVIGCVIAIAFCMWLRYFITNVWVAHKMPPAVSSELAVLRKNPESDPARYHQIIDAWYGLSYSDPSIDSSDWLLLFFLVVTAAPVIFIITLRAVRPVSVHISGLASVARAVTGGNFGVSSPVPERLPDELKRLTKDINLMSGQLSRYEKELKASNVALAHELRSPLTASIGRLQGMLDGIFEPSPAQLSMVMRQLHDLNRLVDDLHLLSLSDAGQLHLSKQLFRIDELVREKIAWVKPRLLEHDLRVNILNTSEITCSADPFRLGQVLSILLDNAIRYAAEGKLIEIDYGVKEKGVFISCSDRGPGVGDDFIESIFTRFSRAEASRSRYSGGSGLGLSIAMAICQTHGGEITASRNEHGGLTFEIFIPA